MKVSDLKDKYKDKLCFIYGAGASLSKIYDNISLDYVSITVNSGIIKNPACDFFVSDDVGVKNWSYFKYLLPKSNCIKLLYRDKLEKHTEGLGEVVLYDHTWWYSPADNKYNLDGLRLTKDEPIIGARISTGSAVHLAYILGCNPIVLLGNDCHMKTGRRYFWQYYPKDKQPYRVSGTAFSVKNQYLGFDSKSFVEYWNKFSEVNKELLEDELKIIDCSESILDCFEKLTIEEVLEKYKKNKK